MQIPIKASSDGIGYASKNPYEWDGKQFPADIQEGDIVTIKDEGTIETGKFGEDFLFKIETRNGIKKARFNQSTLNILAGAWGQDSVAWIGKKVKVLTRKAVIAGERQLVTYFVTDGWYLDEWSELVKDEPVVQTAAPAQYKNPMPDAYNEARNQDAGDIPFVDEPQKDPTEANVPDA